MLPTLAARADDDDNGGDTMTPDMQWRLADKAWSSREFDDAAALNRGFAEMNPDNPNALEALWREYQIYRSYRPNDNKRQTVFDQLTKESVRWSKVYATNDPNRAALALQYDAWVLDQQLGHDPAIPVWQDIIKKYPKSSEAISGYWTLGEWFRAAGRFQDAIPNYEGYTAAAGLSTDNVVNSLLDAGLCYEALKNKDGAMKEYRAIYDGPFPWGWGGTGWSSIAAAEHAKALGEDDFAHDMATRIIEKCPQDETGGWGEIRTRARNILGTKLHKAKQIHIYPYLVNTWTADGVSIDPAAKIPVQRDLHMLVRLENVTKDEPFKATLTLKPKFEHLKDPENMKSDGAGSPTFSADIAAPDAKGNVTGDWVYPFTDVPKRQPLPDDLVVSRKWEKAGAGWGNAIIRIQSKGSWEFWIYMPNEKTNVNNITGQQPNEVRDGGKTFRWYQGYTNLTQGLTLKIPIEIGAAADGYYPHITFDRGGGSPYPNSAASSKDATLVNNEYELHLKSDTDFPFTVEYQASQTVDLPEVTQ